MLIVDLVSIKPYLHPDMAFLHSTTACIIVLSYYYSINNNASIFRLIE